MENAVGFYFFVLYSICFLFFCLFFNKKHYIIVNRFMMLFGFALRMGYRWIEGQIPQTILEDLEMKHI